jgi:hypothetical protein
MLPEPQHIFNPKPHQNVAALEQALQESFQDVLDFLTKYIYCT